MLYLLRVGEAVEHSLQEYRQSGLSLAVVLSYAVESVGKDDALAGDSAEVFNIAF